MIGRSAADPVPIQEIEMNDPNHNLTAPRICHNPNCSFQTHEPLQTCPKCGRPIWTTNQFRLISSVLILCGALLMAMGGGLLYFVAPIGKHSSGTRFTGSEGQKLLILGIFFAIFAFGVSVLAAGLWQVVLGRASRSLITFLLTMFMVILAIAGVGRIALHLLE